MYKSKLFLIFSFIFIFLLHHSKAQLTLENIFLKNKFSPDALDDLIFLNSKENYALLEDYTKSQRISIYNTSGNKEKEINLTQLFKTYDNFPHSVSQFSISNSDKYFLLTTNQSYQYRYSYTANYFLLNNQNIIPLPEQNIQLPIFSPDDSKISFIKDNNLYLYNIKNDLTIPVTKDGSINKIINGKSDWVYEEELELTGAYIWNSKSDKIAYLKFDESQVKEFSFPFYNGQNYPQIFTYKYPKVGEENSKVTLWYYDLKKKKNHKISIKTNYEYLPRIYFSNDGNSIYYMLLNRHQNQLIIEKYNTQNNQTSIVYSEESRTYIDIPAFVLLPDNSFFITSKKENYNQIYYYNTEGELINKITKGAYNIFDIIALDLKNNLIFFDTNKDKISEKQVYSINYKNFKTTALTHESGINKVFFAPQLSYYIHSFSNDTTPTQIRICKTNQTSPISLIDNQKIKALTAAFPKKEFITVKTADSIELEAWIIKPETIDSTQKYPLLMYVYGGPGNQSVLNDYGRNDTKWFKYLAEQGYVVVCIDGRGSGGKSADFEQIIYRNLGKFETSDQIDAAKYLSKLSFIDSTRIGIFGWSYGGFMALNCLEKGNNIFKAAISVAPVTNWIWYDNIYTERYMQTPLENKEGYLNYNPLLNVAKIKGKLLLIHGTADDNVHIQHSFELMSALNTKNIPYESLIYPDKNHSIAGGNTRYDLYKKITAFILRNL